MTSTPTIPHYCIDVYDGGKLCFSSDSSFRVASTCRDPFFVAIAGCCIAVAVSFFPFCLLPLFVLVAGGTARDFVWLVSLVGLV